MIPIHTTAQAGAVDSHCAACDDPLGFEFDFAFQPIVDVRQRRIVAHEALVRGTQGEGADLIMSRVTRANMYTFDQRCRTLAIERAAALGMRERLSINFIANAVRDPRHCIASTFAAARAFHFPTAQIMFEVTGREPVDDHGHLVEIFNAYREYGFHTAIDDFGAGQASLHLLADFQPHIVKIDMHLVRGVDRDATRQAIVGGVLAMCRDLGVQALAEGVETRQERDYLAAAGVDLMQGYWFSRPLFRGLASIDPSRFGD